MTQLQTMSDQELNRKLAELMGWTDFRDGGHGIIWATPPDDRRTYTMPNYCNDESVCADLQAKAIEVNEERYLHTLILITNDIHLDKYPTPFTSYGPDLIGPALNATPRQRAEAAYMTLQAGK